LREALRALGPYFALEPPSATPGWLPVAALVDSPEGLLHRAAAVREALGGDQVPRRVAVSVAQLGLVARLLAPSFGAAVLERRLLDPYGGWWRPVLGGAMPLALSDEALAGPVVSGDLAAALHLQLVDEVLAPVVAHGVALSVSPQVLWGNVASAVNGAATMVARTVPSLAPACASLAADLLDLGALRGTSIGGPDVPGVTGVRFRRRSCCLLYRLGPSAPKTVCGDCVLVGVKSDAVGQ
jgi:hypothetical protein